LLAGSNVLLQVSGTFGCGGKKEAQRLGRILALKSDDRLLTFTLSRQTRASWIFAQHRQLFLTEQGYSYKIEAKEIVSSLLAMTLTRSVLSSSTL